MNITRIKVLGLLSLPLLAIAVALVVFAFNPSSEKTEAATDGAAMSLSVDAASIISCPDGKTPKGAEPLVCVGLGDTFTLSIDADAVPVANGYVLAQGWVNYGDELGNQAANGAVKASAAVWPDVSGATVLSTNTSQGGDARLDSFSIGGLTGLVPPLPASVYKGSLYTLDLTCTAGPSNTVIELIAAGVAPAGTSGALFTEAPNTPVVPAVTGLEVNCAPGPTATPTSTPPPIPKMSKVPALQNVWLTRQGAKVPPADCLSGANIGGLSEQLGQDIVSPDPKDPSVFQQLAAFEFEVHYDSKKVCVDLTEGAAFTAAGAICVAEDSASKPQLEGVARIGCVTIGKGHAIDALVPLAQIDVYPQPEVYSQAKPNQDNGVVVQINNVNCDLSDEQGHAIPIFSCDDADITFRYLEGDVEPDCVIDAVDAQAIAFRWGVTKGSLIYKDFMNLEPSGQQADNDIDINDLQFVFGRFASTCDAPWPAQEPVNPKA